MRFVICHGAGGSGWEWHLAGAELATRGHRMVAADMPSEDESASLADYVDVVVRAAVADEAAAGQGNGATVVGHSLGAFVAPVVAARLDARNLILVAPMIPAPGESANEWWRASGFQDSERTEYDDELALFLHDVEPDLAAEALRRSRDQAARMMSDRFPLGSWPDVDTTVLAFRDDRLFPSSFVRHLTRQRLGVDAYETPGSHCGYLSHPAELAEQLLTFAGSEGSTGPNRIGSQDRTEAASVSRTERSGT